MGLKRQILLTLLSATVVSSYVTDAALLPSCAQVCSQVIQIYPSIFSSCLREELGWTDSVSLVGRMHIIIDM